MILDVSRWTIAFGMISSARLPQNLFKNFLRPK